MKVQPVNGTGTPRKKYFISRQVDDFFTGVYNIYKFMVDYADVKGIDAIIKAYSLYQQQVVEQDAEVEPVLSMTRAWTLVRFVESKMLKMKSCTCCGGEYIVNTYDLNQNYVCNLCHVPSRAGKTKKAKELTYNLVSMTA